MDKFDSDDFSKSSFAPHGHFVLTPSDNIIRNEATGPFNTEAMAAMDGIHKVLIKKIIAHGGPYGSLTVFHKSMMMSLDGVELYRKNLRDLFSEYPHRPVAVAFVAANDIEGTSVVAPYFKDIFEELGTQFQLFSEINVAENWLQQQLNGS